MIIPRSGMLTNCGGLSHRRNYLAIDHHMLKINREKLHHGYMPLIGRFSRNVMDGMDIRLLVESPSKTEFTAVHLRYTGTVSGVLLQEKLQEFFGSESHEWAIASTPIRELLVGQPPLLNGSIVESYRGKGAVEGASTIYSAEIMHGPDSRKAFSLSRGRWSIGRDNCDITLNDPSMHPIEGYMRVDHSGVTYSSKLNSHAIQTESLIKIGNSVLRIGEPRRFSDSFRDTDDVEIELPAPRPKALQVAMILMPLIVGLTIALFTGLWLILAMSVASSMLMALHMISHRGESRKTRNAVLEAAARDLANVRQFGALSIGQEIVLGHHQRETKIRSKQRELSNPPLIDAAPFIVSIGQAAELMPTLPVHTQRLALVHLLAGSSHVSILVTPADSRSYHQLVQPLLAHPSSHMIRRLDSGATGIIICERKPAISPQKAIIFSLSSDEAPTYSDVCLRDRGVNVDGISESTYRALVSSLPTQALNKAGHSIAGSRTSDIEYFAAPPENPFQDAEDVHFFAGIEPETGAALTYGLNTHGPHFLCAGTTGSGKSQFLRSALWSMALTAPPTRLSFILIDFKGGAGLGPLTTLPHCVSSITDLDITQLSRTLKYLRADLKKREKAFHQAGVSSHKDYRALILGAETDLDFPEVVICIDEFKMLVDQHPIIMNEIMRIATIGRSLGYHLFLATQRPQGAVSAEIRANIATAFCLRVSSTQDSYNVISTEDAASIPARSPGVGYAKDSENRLIKFQAPLINGYYGATESEVISISAVCSQGTDDGLGQAAQALTDKELTTLCSALSKQPSFAQKSYTPIAPSLSPRPYSVSASPLSLNIGVLEVPDAGIQNQWWWEEDDGCLLFLASPVERNEHVFTLMEQALSNGSSVFCFSPSEQFIHRVKTRFPASAANCYAYSMKDIDFVRGAVETLIPTRSPTLLVLDCLDQIQDTMARYPDFETQILDLLSPVGHCTVKTICTASSLPRGKFQQLFANVLFSASYLETDPLRSHRKEYNRPHEGQFSVEGTAVQSLVGHAAENGVVCLALPDPEFSPIIQQVDKKLVLGQLPTHLWLKDVPELTEKDGWRIGITRNGSAVGLPKLGGNFIAVSGKKGGGKTNFLRSLMEMNKQHSAIFLPGEAGSTLKQFKDALISSCDGHKDLPILCIDNLHLLNEEIQRFILQERDSFSKVIVAYTPWPRWSTSPILSALSGTETGLVLAPTSVSDLSFYTGAALPWDLKTDGKVPPGRGVLIDHGTTLAFHVPLRAVPRKTGEYDEAMAE